MFLMTFQEGFCPRDIFRQFIRLDDGFGVVRPRDQIPVVSEESLKTVRILQDLFALRCLWQERENENKFK
jgi:hypothetical protein